MTEKWIAWTRPSPYKHGDESTAIRMESEGKPKYSNYSRPATAEEIAEEKAYRARVIRGQKMQRDFESRPEYQDAMAIHDILELMSPENHPLAALTPDEWAALRKKLERGSK